MYFIFKNRRHISIVYILKVKYSWVVVENAWLGLISKQNDFFMLFYDKKMKAEKDNVYILIIIVKHEIYCK